MDAISQPNMSPIVKITSELDSTPPNQSKYMYHTILCEVCFQRDINGTKSKMAAVSQPNMPQIIKILSELNSTTPNQSKYMYYTNMCELWFSRYLQSHNPRWPPAAILDFMMQLVSLDKKFPKVLKNICAKGNLCIMT